MKTDVISRRNLLKGLSFAPLAALGPVVSGEEERRFPPLKGNIRQAVTYSHGNLRSLPVEELAKQLLEIGIGGLDLVNPNEWEAVIKAGLVVTLSRAPAAKITEGFNHVEHHDHLQEVYDDLIPRAAKAGIKQIICFSGNRRKKSDDEGIQNCIIGLKRIVPLAEKHDVTLMMELLNPFGIKDYHADRTAFGAQIARELGSGNFKLLYDIYHMQLSEGNLIDTIRNNKDVIGHYHTAGAPGRQDLDEHQEIYYPAVMRTIAETEFKGFVAHEFSPKKQDNLESLREAVRVCDV